MFHSASINIDKWTVDNVVTWVKGLDAVLKTYHSDFAQHHISGKQLALLDHTDLQRIGVEKIGHQERLLQCTELLLSLNNELNCCNLQTLALSVTLKCNNLQKALQVLTHSPAAQVATAQRDVAESVSYLMKSLRRMLGWLEKAPFSGVDEYVTLHRQLKKASLSVVSVFTKTTKLHGVIKEKGAYLTEKLSEVRSKCDDLIKNSVDPLVIQPAYLDSVTIRKRSDELLGLQLVSTHTGIHTVKVIRHNTPADKCTKLDVGDEIVQVNHQTVVGWQLKNVVSALKERPKEVVLMLKKHPRHFNPQLLMQRRPSPKAALTLGEDLRQSTFPKRASKDCSDEGSVTSGDSKAKSSSVSEGTAPSLSASMSIESTSAFDDVFSPTATHAEPPVYGGENERRSTVSGSVSKKQVRPTILVNSLWDSQTAPKPKVDYPPVTSAKPTGMKEILSSYHVVKSTPELRSPDTEHAPSLADNITDPV